MAQFDRIIMNPPYGEFHFPIFKSSVQNFIKSTGIVTSLQPMTWVLHSWRDDVDFGYKEFISEIEDYCFIEQVLDNGDDTTFKDVNLFINLGIFKVSHTIKNPNIRDIVTTSHGIQFKRFLPFLKSSGVDNIRVEKFDNQQFCVPLKTMLGGNGRGIESHCKVIVRVNYGTIINGICSTTGKSLKDSKTSCSGKIEDWPVVVFDTEQELKNFYNFCHLLSFRFFVLLGQIKAQIMLKYLPFPSDYTKEWTEDSYLKWLGILHEKEWILNVMKQAMNGKWLNC